jgi:AMP nucleosidase
MLRSRKRVSPSNRAPDNMHSIPIIQSPPPIATEAFSDAGSAVARLEEIYERNTQFLRDRFEAYVNGGAITTRVRAYYPFVRMTTSTYVRLDSRLSYGFVAGPGVHETSVTRPDLFRTYLAEQIGLLIKNHGVPVEIGESSEPIPIHFAYRRDINIEAAITNNETPGARSLRDVFDTPNLAGMDDSIADGTFELPPGVPEPLALFRAARVDYSLRRLYHYTGTDPEHFQNFVIFTNYQFYVDAFVQLCQQRLL